MQNIRNIRFLDGKMLNPGLNALWEEEKRRRASLNIKTSLDLVDDEGFKLALIIIFLLKKLLFLIIF